MSCRTQTSEATLGQALPLGHSAPSPLLTRGTGGRETASASVWLPWLPTVFLPADCPWPPTRPLGVPVPDVLDLPGEPLPLKPSQAFCSLCWVLTGPEEE